MLTAFPPFPALPADPPTAPLLPATPAFAAAPPAPPCWIGEPASSLSLHAKPNPSAVAPNRVKVASFIRHLLAERANITNCIGIDDGFVGPYDSAMRQEDADVAAEFAELFKAAYLRFHRRRLRRDVAFTSQQWAVLTHLALSGPLTVGECARHLERAQSVVSEIIDGMEAKGLLERMRDARDRRRVLV